MIIRKDLRRFLLTFLLGISVAFGVSMCGPPLAHAGGNLQVHAASEHAGGCDTCNEENWGIGYVGSGSGARLIAGYYTNSWFRDSFYAGANWRLFGSHALSVSFVGVTGYRGTSDTVDEHLIVGEILPVPLAHINLGPALKSLYLWPEGATTTPAITYAPTQDGGVYLLSFNHRF